jgi:hypothetical protein
MRLESPNPFPCSPFTYLTNLLTYWIKGNEKERVEKKGAIRPR